STPELHGHEPSIARTVKRTNAAAKHDDRNGEALTPPNQPTFVSHTSLADVIYTELLSKPRNRLNRVLSLVGERDTLPLVPNQPIAETVLRGGGVLSLNLHVWVIAPITKTKRILV